MKKQIRTQERYFVGRVGSEWDNHSYQYSTLSEAIAVAFKCKATDDFKGGSGPIFVAKEIGSQIEVDENSGRVNIVPVGDIKSKQPYYLIRDYRDTICTYAGDRDWNCHSVKSGKDLKKLVVQNDLSQLGRDIHLAHGLELKIR